MERPASTHSRGAGSSPADAHAWAKPSREEYLAAFAKIIDTGAYIGGPQVGEFETAFAT